MNRCYICQWKWRVLSFRTLMFTTPHGLELNSFRRQRNRGSIYCNDQQFLCSVKRPNRLWDISSYAFSGWGEMAPLGTKRPGCEAINVPHLLTDVKNMWIYTPTLPYLFMTCTWTTLSLPWLVINCSANLLTYSMQQSPSWEANWFCS